MRAVSAALKLSRADFFIGITGGTVELVMLHPVFGRMRLFYFVNIQKGLIKYDKSYT